MKTQEPRNDGKYNSKANTVCILKILQEYSDGNIILPTSRIIEFMDSVYGLHVDRRTVYSSIDILQKLGYPIETYEDNGIGYCLTDKPFDVLDIKILIDSLCLNKLIPMSVERQIINKLMDFIPTKEKRYRFGNIIRTGKKEKNIDLFLSLDTVDIAMQQKKKIEFDHVAKDGTLSHFIQTPIEVHQLNNSYYLICLDFETNHIIRYNLKHVRNVTISAENSDKYHNLIGFDAFNQEDVDLEYIIATLRIDSEIKEKFVEIFDNASLRHKNIEYSSDHKTFSAQVWGTEESISRWALAYTDKCEIIEPLELREAVINKLKNNRYGV